MEEHLKCLELAKKVGLHELEEEHVDSFAADDWRGAVDGGPQWTGEAVASVGGGGGG